jgi:hypothetical protein
VNGQWVFWVISGLSRAKGNWMSFPVRYYTLGFWKECLRVTWFDLRPWISRNTILQFSLKEIILCTLLSATYNTTLVGTATDSAGVKSYTSTHSCNGNYGYLALNTARKTSSRNVEGLNLSLIRNDIPRSTFSWLLRGSEECFQNEPSCTCVLLRPSRSPHFTAEWTGWKGGQRAARATTADF